MTRTTRDLASRGRTRLRGATLILADRWRDGTRSKGLSDLHYLWRGASDHFPRVLPFHPDTVSPRQVEVDRRLLEVAARQNIRRVLYLPTFRKERVADHFPSLHVLDYLVSEKGCSLILVSPDWCAGQMRRYATESLGHLLSGNLVLDLPQMPPGISRFPRSAALWPPADESRFFPGEETRPIDVLFIGTMNDKRRLLLDALGDMPGRNMVLRDRGAGREISAERYGLMTRQAKIVLNQSSAYGLEQDQLKGRVTEALAAGCCLLDNSQEQTPSCFRPGRDYVQYNDPTEVCARVAGLMDSGDWRKIGEKGHKTYQECFSLGRFWERAAAEIRDFEAVDGVNQPKPCGKVPTRSFGLVATFTPGDIFLERWVDQLLAQEQLPDEVVCSSPEFSERERSSLQRIPGIRLVERPDRCAWEGILNALRASTTEYLLISLSDERLMPGALRRARTALARAKGEDVLVGQIWDCDEHGQRRCLVKPEPARDRFDLMAGKVMLPLAASIFRRSALVSIGLHRTDWTMDCGEYELWLRLLARDRIRTIPVCLTEYPSRKESLSLGAKNRARESRGRMKCALMNLHVAPFHSLGFRAKANLLRLLAKRAFLDTVRTWGGKNQTQTTSGGPGCREQWQWAGWLRSWNNRELGWRSRFSILRGRRPPARGQASLEADADWILSRPGGCLVGKIGTTELLALEFSDRRFQTDFVESSSWRRPALRLFKDSGVFPVQRREFQEFLSLYRQAVRHLDGIQLWQSEPWLAFYEAAVVSRELPQARHLNGLTLSPCLVPYLSHLRWLVVSPFVKTMKSQLKKLGAIHPPGREDWRFTARRCRFIACPHLAALVPSPYASWSDGLADLSRQIAQAEDFDVLIVGAGAWSLPLLLAAKERGKIGIHMGGPTQSIFGIKGGRWDSHGIYTRDWVRPLPEETPARFFQKEKGCYW